MTYRRKQKIVLLASLVLILITLLTHDLGGVACAIGLNAGFYLDI